MCESVCTTEAALLAKYSMNIHQSVWVTNKLAATSSGAASPPAPPAGPALYSLACVDKRYLRPNTRSTRYTGSQSQSALKRAATAADPRVTPSRPLRRRNPRLVNTIVLSTLATEVYWTYLTHWKLIATTRIRAGVTSSSGSKAALATWPCRRLVICWLAMSRGTWRLLRLLPNCVTIKFIWRNSRYARGLA